MHDSRGRVISDSGEFTILNGAIYGLDEKYLVGQYVRVIGSIFNDGVYKIEGLSNGRINISIDESKYPTWVQPTGAVDAYKKGDRVTHNGIRYISLIDSNVTVPGADTRYWEAVNEAEHLLQDEKFTGIVVPLAIPKDFLKLVDQIEKFHSSAISNPNFGMIKSESFGGYSYTMASAGLNGLPVTWKESFSSRLNNYRKMIEERI